jgi:hypothetical protein
MTTETDEIKNLKTLDDIKRDMSTLYDEVNSGKTELKTAAELANIAGKYLKAEQLQLAREIFIGQLGNRGKIAGHLTQTS